MPEISGSSHSSKKTRGRRGSARPARERVETALELVGERLALVRAADDAAEDADHLQDLGDAALVEGEHRIAALDQLAGDVGLQIRERQDQIGLQRLDLVDSARAGTTDTARLLPRFGRPDRVAGDADDAIAFTEEVERLGGLFGQADDAAGKTSWLSRGDSAVTESIGMIGEHESVAVDDLAEVDIDRAGEHRAVIDERMELAVLAARVDAGRQIGEQRAVEVAAGEAADRGRAGRRTSGARAGRRRSCRRARSRGRFGLPQGKQRRQAACRPAGPRDSGGRPRETDRRTRRA